MSLRAVLFDLDGTLIDTASDFTLVLNEMLGERQHPPQDYQAVRQQVSNGARAVLHLGFSITEDSPNFSELLNEFFDRYEQQLAVGSCLFPGMDAVLQNLEDNGINWGIVTNKPARFTTPLLQALKLDTRCAVAICPDHVRNRKPDPEPILLACEKIACRSDEAIYVGDHIRDIDAGRNANMPTVACRYGYIEDGENIEDWCADHIIATPQELLSIVALHNHRD